MERNYKRPTYLFTQEEYDTIYESLQRTITYLCENARTHEETLHLDACIKLAAKWE